MKLSVVIPALNEEASIASIIERTLAAESYIIANSAVTALEIIVVSDGSTDQTVTIATTYIPKIKLIVFEKNKGYGAAIKQGWSEANGELLAFLDADGTCEPQFFANLVNLLTTKNADVVLGCRLNKESKMPFIRRLGNFIFAKLLTFLSSNYVKDTASGMRVVKKSSLKKIYPLPDGLHFTPAMSARALLNEHIVIAEEDMPYHEREGESKLSVTKDGVRFLKVILSTAFLYRPHVIFNTISIFVFLLAAVVMLEPTMYYFSHHRVEEVMIYRFIVGEVLGIFAFSLFSASYIVQSTIRLSILDSNDFNMRKGAVASFFESKLSWIVAILFVLIGLSLIYDSLLTRIETGKTYTHWSRYFAFSFCEIIALLIFITKFSRITLKLLKYRMLFVQSDYYKKL
jgi:glycosyltransferase involved in cell wall biosynthesis